MEVINYDFKVDKFEVNGDLEGKNSIYPKYGYTLIPPTDKTPCIFKMTLHQEIVGDKSGKITFDTHSETEIDNQNKTPTVEFLYQLVLSTCRSSTIEFGKKILEKGCDRRPRSPRRHGPSIAARTCRSPPNRSRRACAPRACR